jgi:hypothetical protein
MEEQEIAAANGWIMVVPFGSIAQPDPSHTCLDFRHARCQKQVMFSSGWALAQKRKRTRGVALAPDSTPPRSR